MDTGLLVAYILLAPAAGLAPPCALCELKFAGYERSATMASPRRCMVAEPSRKQSKTKEKAVYLKATAFFYGSAYRSRIFNSQGYCYAMFTKNLMILWITCAVPVQSTFLYAKSYSPSTTRTLLDCTIKTARPGFYCCSLLSHNLHPSSSKDCFAIGEV